MRYADDTFLLVKTKRLAQRILEHIVPYLEGKLRLKVATGKTVIAYIGKVKFWRYRFYPTKEGIKLRVHPKSISKMKAKIKELTSRSNGQGYQ